MKPFKAFFRFLLDRFGPTLIAGLLYLIDWSLRWNITFLGSKSAVEKGLEKEVIFAYWHNQQLVMLFAYQRYLMKLAPHERVVVTLSSQHQDGRLIANTVKHFGVENLAGSSTRGQVTAIRGMCRSLREGKNVSITPDGPRGPPYEVKRGIYAVAQETGAAIIPVGLAASRRWSAKSWDAMFLPKPFAHVEVVVGDPILVRETPETEAIELITSQLSLVWNTAQSLADKTYAV